jgi:hypothetical protein
MEAAYNIAGIDVHKKMLAVVIANASVPSQLIIYNLMVL